MHLTLFQSCSSQAIIHSSFISHIPADVSLAVSGYKEILEANVCRKLLLKVRGSVMESLKFQE